MANLFDAARRRPLADRMRPATFDAFLGQDHLVGDGKPLRRLLESRGPIPSMILWGPPGCGKTTLARLISLHAGLAFEEFSAVTSGVKEARAVIAAARHRAEPTILFVDEIHRFNRAQQDAFLPCVEDGTVILIGATTENPSFEVNAPLLSRCAVYMLHALADEQVGTLLDRAGIEMRDGARDALVGLAGGDARAALNVLETTAASGDVTAERVREVAQRRVLRYDKDREEHYNVVSAFIKSMRGSDADAALYWMARMLEAGEDPLFVSRRMVIFASEDVGNADPRALLVANAAKEAVDFVGMPEGWIPLAQAATYLSTAPKSNASYKAYLAAREDVEKTRNDPVPLHLRNAPTKLMKDLEYGKGYQYAHDFEGAKTDQQHLPENLRGREYYKPGTAGFETEIRRRIEEHRAARRKPPSI
ncbi:MAG: AAA family ATPase [Candidatus Handelsmanbacteria bacterium RIFCSPLOWO2_12_FULL_64_10]|uniref:AAA family ATPase n=1 Tax=Handelsmanbacteria sp. (strain RIFCSPLOWO2_12_FULL_64_10) TaxID=1817868 RepID=A0A1F6C589_HANXR|nr:MAG: AAA family ATPase [Candidatus Handelsmanbacteria bacterium RIFCSPLOWO2_12_FULL_64_10]